MKTLTNQFLLGLSAPFVGALLIARHRSLFRLAVLPFVFTVLIFAVGLAFGLPFVTRLVEPFTQGLLTFFGFKTSAGAGAALTLIFPFLIWPALALALIFILLNITRLVASPFYALLAEKVLRNAGALSSEKQGVIERFKINFRQTRASLLKTAFFLVMGLVLGLVSFIPGVGILTSFCFLILLAYDIVDYSLEALTWPLRKRIEFFKGHFAIFLGLGVSLGLLFLVPGVNFFVLPAAVCGSGDLVRRLICD